MLQSLRDRRGFGAQTVREPVNDNVPTARRATMLSTHQFAHISESESESQEGEPSYSPQNVE
jgi:hypothetical protein